MLSVVSNKYGIGEGCWLGFTPETYRNSHSLSKICHFQFYFLRDYLPTLNSTQLHKPCASKPKLKRLRANGEGVLLFIIGEGH